jgi:hypothetical protein
MLRHRSRWRRSLEVCFGGCTYCEAWAILFFVLSLFFHVFANRWLMMRSTDSHLLRLFLICKIPMLITDQIQISTRSKHSTRFWRVQYRLFGKRTQAVDIEKQDVSSVTTTSSMDVLRRFSFFNRLRFFNDDT